MHRWDEEMAVHAALTITCKNIRACAAFSMRFQELDLHARQLLNIESIKVEPSIVRGKNITNILENE